jgi:hypothetical protein
MRSNMTKLLHHVLLLSMAAGLAGCAAVRHTPAMLATASADAPRVLAAAIDLRLDTGYGRTLKAGSRWLRQGTLAQGTVYKPWQDVLTLEGAHIHEAWLVLRDDRLVGFYLPAEQGFSPLTPPVPLHFNH